MANCEPYDECDPLDGRLVINQLLHGPALAVEAAELPLGALRSGSQDIRAFVNIEYLQQWVPGEICLGPVRSIIGLAPTETLTIDIRQGEERSYTTLVQRALESSQVSTHSRMSAIDLVDPSWNGETVDLEPVYVRAFGSIFEDAWDWTVGAAEDAADAVGDVVGGIGEGIGNFFEGVADVVGGIADGITGFVEDLLGDNDAAPGGPGTGIDRTLTVVDEILDAVTTSQSQRTLTETTTSQTTFFEQTVTRTLSNPYSDRTLELRLSPVFRTFEVVTKPFQATFGLSATLRRARFVGRDFALLHGEFIQQRAIDPRVASLAALGAPDDDDGLAGEGQRAGALPEHLNANVTTYLPKYLGYLQQRRQLATLAGPLSRALRGQDEFQDLVQNLRDSLEWSKVRAVDSAVLVPFDLARLRKKVPEIYGRIPRPNPFDPSQLRELADAVPLARTRTVRLFVGTHIEAVGGSCVLDDVPDRP